MEYTPDYKESFRDCKTPLLIAIHVGLNPAETAGDIDVAFGEGADGIFLIKDYNTLATDDDVLAAYQVSRRRHALQWIGINLLDHMATEAVMAIKDSVNGLWFDRAYVDTDAIYLEKVQKQRDIFRSRTLLFPCVAFKYQKAIPPERYGQVVKLAERHTDTIVTSGDATGVAADYNKIRAMRAATKLPLGLASGVSVDNVDEYLRIGVDFFIVNTSISNEAGRLAPEKLAALRRAIPQR